jgi:hypothetical protein
LSTFWSVAGLGLTTSAALLLATVVLISDMDSVSLRHGEKG